MIHTLKVVGAAQAKVAHAAGARFNPRGNKWEFTGEALPAELAQFVPGYREALMAAQNAAPRGGRNIDGPNTLAEWRAQNGGR